MKAFVINMERSSVRRERMNFLLKNTALDYEYISAVDGKALSDEEKNILFNIKKSINYYARDILAAEIGCTLSHQKIYRKIVSEDINYALILEDDIESIFIPDSVCSKIENVLNSDQPVCVLLSGMFWWYKYYDKDCFDGHRMVCVYDGALTHSYFVNKAACIKMMAERPFFRADEWGMFKKLGIAILGIVPHLVNQVPESELSSTIQGNNPIKYVKILGVLRLCMRGLKRRFFCLLNKYEV